MSLIRRTALGATLLPGLLALMLALSLAPPATAQDRPSALNTTAIAGQTVAVLPLTLMVAAPGLHEDSVYAPYRDRRTGLAWADSVTGEALLTHAPEIPWVLPPAVRKMARRSAGFVADPDQMGQAIMRAPGLKRVPDPLRSSLRKLVALANGRYALIPAALGFTRDSAGVHADYTLVLVDARRGEVLWRTRAPGAGPTPALALGSALRTMFVTAAP